VESSNKERIKKVLSWQLLCLSWNLPARPGKKKGVSGFVGSRLSKTRLMTVKKKKWPGLTRVWPGGLGSESTRRVDRVFPGQFPSGFLPQPGPVPGPGWPGPGLTRRAGPGFKTLLRTQAYNCNASPYLMGQGCWFSLSSPTMSDLFLF